MAKPSMEREAWQKTRRFVTAEKHPRLKDPDLGDLRRVSGHIHNNRYLQLSFVDEQAGLFYEIAIDRDTGRTCVISGPSQRDAYRIALGQVGLQLQHGSTAAKAA